MGVDPSWLESTFTEHPHKIASFREAVLNLQWDEKNCNNALSVLFREIDKLAEAEVSYYFRRRRTRSLLSGVFRTGAWISGTAGALLPLLATADKSWFGTWGTLGYVLLALAASFLAANALFGGTSGHARFVSAQLTLEKLITAKRVDWCELACQMERLGNTPEIVARGFAIVREYSEAFYSATLSETAEWSRSVVEEASKYAKSVGVGK